MRCKNYYNFGFWNQCLTDLQGSFIKYQKNRIIRNRIAVSFIYFLRTNAQTPNLVNHLAAQFGRFCPCSPYLLCLQYFLQKSAQIKRLAYDEAWACSCLNCFVFGSICQSLPLSPSKTYILYYFVVILRMSEETLFQPLQIDFNNRHECSRTCIYTCVPTAELQLAIRTEANSYIGTVQRRWLLMLLM